MRKLILLLLSFISVISSTAQNVLHDPVTGRIFNSEKYSGVNGSPFLFDEWIAGSATTLLGTYNNLELKLDAYSNTVFFKRNDEPFEFQDKIIAFTLMRKPGDSSSYMQFKNGFSGSGVKADQYLQVVTEGKVSLYRSDIKLLSDVNQINQGVIKTFTTSTRYYYLKNNSLQPLKLTKKEVLELVKDKEQEVESYVQQHNLSLKKESDLARIVRFYNTL